MMKKLVLVSSLLVSLLGGFTVSTLSWAGDGLDSFLNRINVQARADINGFTVGVSGQFGVSDAQVRLVLKRVNDPGDAFMIFQLGKWSQQPIERIVSIYEKKKGQA